LRWPQRWIQNVFEPENRDFVLEKSSAVTTCREESQLRVRKWSRIIQNQDMPDDLAPFKMPLLFLSPLVIASARAFWRPKEKLGMSDNRKLAEGQDSATVQVDEANCFFHHLYRLTRHRDNFFRTAQVEASWKGEKWKINDKLVQILLCPFLFVS
jgi:hypothetical protein